LSIKDLGENDKLKGVVNQFLNSFIEVSESLGEKKVNS